MKEVHWWWVVISLTLVVIGLVAAYRGDYAAAAYMNTLAILLTQRT